MQRLTLYVVLLQVNSLQQRDEIGATFPRSVLSPSQDVPPRQGDGNALLLPGEEHMTLVSFCD